MKKPKRDSVVPKMNFYERDISISYVRHHLKYASRATYFDSGIVWNRDAWAEGPWFTDMDGNIVLDFVSHIAASPLGYNHPRIIDAQLEVARVSPDRYAGTDFIVGHGNASFDLTPAYLHERLEEITRKFGFHRHFFSNSGAEAVENAIKLAYDYKRNNGYGICLDGAFHGRTLGALSLNRSKAVQRKWYPQIPKIISVPFNDVEGLHSVLRTVDGEEIAFFIIEPFQGEGGYRIMTEEFMRAVVDLTATWDIPLIVDEIQSGVGRTGKWWMVEHYREGHLIPDIITSAKALQIGATMGRTEFFPAEDGRISSTWGEGNAIATAVGCTIIDVISQEDLLVNAKTRGDQLMTGLGEIFPEFDISGRGLMVAVHFDKKETQDKILHEAVLKGLLLAGCGEASMRFLPPLNVTKREIDIALNILEEVYET